jgi:hypothetical protein
MNFATSMLTVATGVGYPKAKLHKCLQLQQEGYPYPKTNLCCCIVVKVPQFEISQVFIADGYQSRGLIFFVVTSQ